MSGVGHVADSRHIRGGRADTAGMDARSDDARAAICVVGLGPRGLSVVERVCANAVATGRPVTLHVVDPYLGEGGRVWRTEQSNVLLMNTVASQVTMFTDATVACDGPVRTGPSLYEWSTLLLPTEPVGAYPEWVHDEATGLGPDSYPTRAFYGHYLRWVFERLIAFADGTVTVVTHGANAEALVDEPDGTQTVTLSTGDRLSGLDSVVLALGHLDMPPTDAELALGELADANGLVYIPPGNPGEADLNAIAPGQVVALRGLGLNFFDHLALLTVGRGGAFVRNGDALTYRPSGREPMLVAGSRRGVPYHARGGNQKGVSGRHLPLFLTPEAIKELRGRGATNFTQDVWPLVDLEVRSVYYRALVARAGGDQDAFTEAFRSAPDDVDLLRRFGIDALPDWDWDRIARPYGERAFATDDEYRAWLLEHLGQDLHEARLGNVHGPLKAALDVMRDIRNEIRLVVDHGGLVGGSYRDQLQSWYTPLNAYVSIGPPAHRIAEMIALIEAGLLRVCGPGMTVTASPAGFAVSSAIPGPPVTATALVDARLPVVDIRTTTDPLVRGLLADGACRTYRIPDVVAGDYVSGGLAVTPKPYRLIDADGRPHPRRFAFGVPTEPVHWGTAAGIRPGVDSVILGDADAIARACLAADQADQVVESAEAAA